jgi:hypothetical protein
MSAALQKRNQRLEHVSQSSLIDTVIPSSILILIVAILIAVLGHFSPAG